MRREDIDLLEYTATKVVLLLISVTSSAVNFGFVYYIIVVLINGYKNIRAAHIALGAVCTTLIYVLPQFAVEYLFYYPGVTNQFIESLILFPNPFYLLSYYWIMRRVMKLPAVCVVASLEEVICAQYMVLLLFRLYCGLWAGIIEPANRWPILLDVDVLAMASMFATTLTVTLIIRGVMKKKELPG